MDILTILFTGAGGLIGELAADVFDQFMTWIYQKVFFAIAEFFNMMGGMGSELFEYSWIRATVNLFTLLGWALFVCGIVVAVFDTAMQYQNGVNAFKNLALNVLKGFFAVNLIGILPVRLYQFCISLQLTFSGELINVGSSSVGLDISEQSGSVLGSIFGTNPIGLSILFLLIFLIMFAYCIIKIFFQNLMRGGILLTQIAIGSFHMFGVPRGYVDGFKSWIKQIIAICITAFMQTSLLFLGLMTMTDNMLFGLGVIFAAKEVPRICQQFGMETSFNMGQVINNVMTTVRVSNAVNRVFSKPV